MAQNITTSTSPATGYSYSIGTANVSATTYNWANANVTWSASSIVNDQDIKPATLQVKGNAEFDGDVTIQGKNLKESLEKIEERLAILHPNEELEERWEQLRELRKLYMEMEQDLIEKEKMWAILKR
jgi:hypothetical protein